MTEVLIQFFTGGLGIASAFGIVIYILGAATEGLNDKVVTSIGIVIKDFSLGNFVKSFSKYAGVLLNIFFTEKYFSRRWLLRSFSASALFCLLLHSLYFFSNPGLLIKHHWLPFITNFVTYFLVYTCFDFLVLWKTQLILKKLNKKKSWGLPTTLVIDIFTSFLFGFLKYLVIIFISGIHTGDIQHFFSNVVIIKVPDEFVQHGYGVIPGLFFYTTFLYTLFFTLYFISVCFWAIAVSYDWIKEKFDVVNKPFKFIQFIAGIILLIVVIIILITKIK